ncbi:MAG: PRC-barrel domain-containing protein [Hyphomicrobiaceae bacterium]|jgi:hypothetical protein
MKGHAMLRTLLAAGLLGAALSAAPASAQQSQPPPAPSAQPDSSLVGLPVYSSDGHKLGDVTEVGTFGGKRMLRAEIGTFLGMGSSPVLIPADMFARKDDRIEVAMSADEVRDTVSRQKQQQQEK